MAMARPSYDFNRTCNDNLSSTKCHTMYTHVSKCKNDKIKREKRKH
jgi:hypothetical protein